MKKIITSTGMVALGVAGLQAVDAYGQDAAKSWSVQGGLRGFYDSNSTASADGFEIESFGIGVDAGVSYNLPLDQTFLGADYTYGLKWYEGRDSGETDQSHRFNLKVDHTFSERYKITLKDSFVVTSEPTVLDQGGAITARSQSDAMRNRANLDFAAQFAPKLGATIGYGNTWYNYDQEASDVPAPSFFPSRSQLLDRMEHLVPVEGRYTLKPETIVLGGYQYGLVDYSDDAPYFVNIPGAVGFQSPSWRNNQSHYIYGGVEHNFTPQLNAALRGGVQIINFNDLPAGATVDDSSTNPYVDGNLSYLYNPGSYVLLGYRHSSSATDLTVLDNETDLIYLNWTHRITTQLNVNLTYQWQYSSFEQAFNFVQNGESEIFNILGLNLSYSINRFLTGEIGYNFDDLDSDVVGRSYTRHVGYIGVRATY